MHSKNKPSQTRAEREHVSKLAQLPCVICEAEPVEIHEPEQGYWFISIPLCKECHTGSKGWHGTRDRWKLRKMDELGAINKTIGELYGKGLM